MDTWDLTLRFFSLADANVRYTLSGCVTLGLASGIIGSFAFLQRKSLVGDTLAHAALPGVCLAFLLTGVKAPLPLLIGASLSGWIGALAVNVIVRRSRLKLDAALGMTLSVFFGVGVLLLTLIQQSGSGNQAGLDKFIFGQAAALTPQDIQTIGVVTLLITVVTALLFKELKLLTFDESFGAALGRPTQALQFVMT
ncbi:MAG TPA: metal ABC transporter permease, partial [candidate division Zixibacteria bacterium]|nr:metal ABC transporter permease [candidate division Zixibacteria bacterium]